jgi:hypothetical protein
MGNDHSSSTTMMTLQTRPQGRDHPSPGPFLPQSPPPPQHTHTHTHRRAHLSFPMRKNAWKAMPLVLQLVWPEGKLFMPSSGFTACLACSDEEQGLDYEGGTSRNYGTFPKTLKFKRQFKIAHFEKTQEDKARWPLELKGCAHNSVYIVICCNTISFKWWSTFNWSIK